MSRQSPGSRRSSALTFLLTAVLALAIGQRAHAQPVVDKVPADALLYVGWHGYESNTPGFDGSHLKAVLDAGEFRKLVDVTLPAFMEKVAQQDPNAAEGMTVLKPLILPMLKYETALFVAKPTMAAGQQPMGKGGIICKAGPDAEAMVTHVQNLLKDAPPKEKEQFKVKREGDLVTLTLGYPEALPGEKLSASANY